MSVEEPDVTNLSNCFDFGAGVAAFALAATAITTAKEYTVAVIPPAYTSPFHVAVKDGAVEEAKKLGW